MFNKRHRASSIGGAGVSGLQNNNSRRQNPSAAINYPLVRNNTADEGVVAFGLWLYDPNHGDHQAAPIILKEFHLDSLVLLHDNMLEKDMAVRITDGVPFCSECRSDDCIHVGFAVCAEQMQRRKLG